MCVCVCVCVSVLWPWQSIPSPGSLIDIQYIQLFMAAHLQSAPHHLCMYLPQFFSHSSPDRCFHHGGERTCPTILNCAFKLVSRVNYFSITYSVSLCRGITHHHSPAHSSAFLRACLFICLPACSYASLLVLLPVYRLPCLLSSFPFTPHNKPLLTNIVCVIWVCLH